MHATLLDLPINTPETSIFCANCPAVQRLERALEELRADFRREVGYWKSRRADAVKRIEQLKEELDQSRGQTRALQDKLFGRKSEKSARSDRSNDLFDSAADSTATVSGDVRLRCRATNADGPATAEADPQRQLGDLDLGARLAGQVFVVSADGAAAGATSAV